VPEAAAAPAPPAAAASTAPPADGAGAVETALREHPAVRDARVAGGIAWVEPGRALAASAAEQAAHLERWRTLWSDTWQRSLTEAAAGGSPPIARGMPPEAAAGGSEAPENLAGWISSYTGKPIAEREMREWLQATVERVVELAPRRLLEIGCGTGLLLARLAPGCAACWGSDFSAAALDCARRALAGTEPPVTLLRRTADDLAGLPERFFDTVVLNSIVQYFPDLAYLGRVLAGVLRAAAPGARIFVGDVRSLPLLAAFHASVLLAQADGATPLSELREQLAARLARERELLVDPAFFTALAHAQPAIAAATAQLKRGRARNELTRFRYDVVLQAAGGAPPPTPPARWLDWRQERLTPLALRRLLATGSPAALGVAGVPNARTAGAVRALALLRGGAGGAETVAGLQDALERDRAAGASGIEPEDLWAVERDLPYSVELRLGRSGPAELDAVLRRRGEEAGGSRQPGPGEEADAVPANQPCRPLWAEELEADLRRYLAARLPAAELPLGVMVVAAIASPAARHAETVR